MPQFKDKINVENLYILAIAAIVGLVLSLYLFYQYTQPVPIVCLGDTNTCETVRQSEYAVFLGIMLPFWGSLYFLTLVFLFLLPALVDLTKYKKYYYIGTLLLVVFGFLFEARLTYIQFFILNAVCIWCTLIEITMTALTFFYAYTFMKFQTLPKAVDSKDNPTL